MYNFSQNFVVFANFCKTFAKILAKFQVGEFLVLFIKKSLVSSQKFLFSHNFSQKFLQNSCENF